MPELPEVETVRATLANQIIGKKIIKVDVFYERMIESDLNEFKSLLIGQTIQKIQRYGKYLFFVFDNVSIISHLRMEGKYFIKHDSDEIVKHEHVIFTFSDGMTLRYHDTRKFGIMKLVKTTDYMAICATPEVAKLGKQANDPTLTSSELYNILKNLKAPIKTALLDQENICGLGNIYVDEVDFAARLNPNMMACNITMNDADNIVKNAKAILDNAIICGGTTIRSYTSSLGVTGRFQINLKVHTKEGEPCPNCGTIIEKTKVGGRGTYYCPKCQNRMGKLIGITGGIGCGKSIVTEYLINNGYHVIDCDKISHDITDNNQEVINKIASTFGEEYLLDGKLNRQKIGQLVYNDADANKKLKDIIHPVVIDEIINQAYSMNDELIFVDVPLLYESHLEYLFNKVICVCCDYETNLKRLMDRDHIDFKYAEQKINSQLSLEKKKNLADYIIDNSGDLCYTYKNINQVLKEIK